MKTVELLAKLVEPSAPDEWYVTDGATSIGPVNLELLARGITAGKVPLDAFVRHASWQGWRGLSDLVEQAPSFDPKRTFRMLPAAKAPRVAPRSEHGAPPKPPVPNAPPRETLPSVDVEPDIEEIEAQPDTARGSFDGASDLPEALLLLLASAVEKTKADAALVHRTREDGAVVVCSHGARMFELLGDKLPSSDPVLFAAKQGSTVLAEPVSGIGGRAMKARLARLGSTVESAFMVPLTFEGKLLATIEVGREKPFRARDAGAVEELVDDLIETMRRQGWSAEWQSAPVSSRKQ